VTKVTVLPAASVLILMLLSGSLAAGPFRGALDTDRIGIFGYSKGGALAGQVSATGKRVKAGINLGGFSFGGLARPQHTVHDLRAR
jgi:hypothetical protein